MTTPPAGSRGSKSVWVGVEPDPETVTGLPEASVAIEAVFRLTLDGAFGGPLDVVPGEAVWVGGVADAE
jgi:hypothetical protein